MPQTQFFDIYMFRQMTSTISEGLGPQAHFISHALMSVLQTKYKVSKDITQQWPKNEI